MWDRIWINGQIATMAQAAMDKGLGKGAADAVRRLTVNIGTRQGGVKVNVLSAYDYLNGVEE